jgi:hypothetical protein
LDIQIVYFKNYLYIHCKNDPYLPKNQKYGQGGVLVLPWSAKGQDERSEPLYRPLFDGAS